MNKIIQLIKKWLEDRTYLFHQVFFTANKYNDEMEKIYEDNKLIILYCKDWEYIEILGLSEEEKKINSKRIKVRCLTYNRN